MYFSVVISRCGNMYSCEEVCLAYLILILSVWHMYSQFTKLFQPNNFQFWHSSHLTTVFSQLKKKAHPKKEPTRKTTLTLSSPQRLTSNSLMQQPSVILSHPTSSMHERNAIPRCCMFIGGFCYNLIWWRYRYDERHRVSIPNIRKKKEIIRCSRPQ